MIVVVAIPLPHPSLLIVIASMLTEMVPRGVCGSCYQDPRPKTQDDVDDDDNSHGDDDDCDGDGDDDVYVVSPQAQSSVLSLSPQPSVLNLSTSMPCAWRKRRETRALFLHNFC